MKGKVGTALQLILSEPQAIQEARHNLNVGWLSSMRPTGDGDLANRHVTPIDNSVLNQRNGLEELRNGTEEHRPIRISTVGKDPTSRIGHHDMYPVLGLDSVASGDEDSVHGRVTAEPGDERGVNPQR